MTGSSRAALALLSLTANAAAYAQSSLEDAQATVAQLLDGAGQNLTDQNGKDYSGVARMSGARPAGRCTTRFSLDYPNNDELPEKYRGYHDDNGSIDWSTDVQNPEAQGSAVYYNAVGQYSGRLRRFHYVFGSPSEAQAFVEAATTLVKACTGGGDDDTPVDEEVIDPNGKVASLAIDRDNGNRYGWAVDYDSAEAADQRALSECARDGSSCHVVLRFTGGCGAYAVDSARGSTAYGWGTADSRGGAESRARSEVANRGGTDIVTRVWGCNSTNAVADQASAAQAAAEARAKREQEFQEKLRQHDEDIKAHEAAVEQYQQQLQNTKDAMKAASDRGAEAISAYQAQLAKSKAAQDEYEKEQQAYREEYKKATGHYPDGS